MKQTSRVICAMLSLFLLLSAAGCSAPSDSGPSQTPGASSPSALAFSGGALADGQVGEQYSQSVSTETDGVTYAVHYEDRLPLGLEMSEDGTISGVPQEAGELTFTVVAMTAEDMIEADFTINIQAGSLTFAAKPLPDAATGAPYVQSIATADGAVYGLKEGSVLPAGLSLSEDGLLSGVPETAGTAAFTVAASAGGASAEAEFSLNIAEGTPKSTGEGRIIFEGRALPAGEVGGDYNQSVASAYGVPGITYEIQYVDGIGLPKGLVFNPLGILAGIPLDSTAGEMAFKVIASAEGYESVTADFTLQIFDVYEQTNRFEAEYIDVSRLKGAGYSSSPTGTGMLQKFANASNGYTLGYLHKAISFEFHFTSDIAASGALTLGFGTETGTITYTPESLAISVNGVPLEYGSITVEENGAGQSTQFQSIPLSPSVDILAGDNVVTFEVKDTMSAGGDGTMTAIGPVVDYIEVQADGAVIGWRPKVANTK